MRPSLILLPIGVGRLFSFWSRYGWQMHQIPLDFSSKKPWIRAKREEQVSCVTSGSCTVAQRLSMRSFRNHFQSFFIGYSSTLIYSRASHRLVEHSNLFQSFFLRYSSTLIYSRAFYRIVEHSDLFQSFSLDCRAPLSIPELFLGLSSTFGFLISSTTQPDLKSPLA